MLAVSNAAKILRLGTGIGYNFSNLRPKGALIKKLQTEASGPLSFMGIFEAMASCIASSGHRRGAQMGILNCDSPDIFEFVDAKLTPGRFRHFNLSVGISDAFMKALEADADWPLHFGGQVYRVVKAKELWDKIMRNAYNSAEPGVLYLDRMNEYNNLHYCEKIEATNPCSEQPLPAHGLCLIGSFNLTKYITGAGPGDSSYIFNRSMFLHDVPLVVEALDNIFEKSIYAIPEHKAEALSKRRIGIGLTGIANAVEIITGDAYGGREFNDMFRYIARTLRDATYRASINLAKKRGAFPLFDTTGYMRSKFVRSLPNDIQEDIVEHGIRNSHLLSYAPCGTISQVSGNVSSGVEPVFYHNMSRDVHMANGLENITLTDYNVRTYGQYCKTLDQCSIEDHLSVAAIAQENCDSSVSKTANVPTSCTYAEYQQIYRDAYAAGLKGFTVYRPNDIRPPVISENQSETPVKEFAYGQSGSCVDGKCEL
jgi:ribonucleoside-diphosphate reductase alpha chain